MRLALLLLLLATTSYAQDVTLSWDASPTTDPVVAGYNIYYQAAPYVLGQWDGTGAVEGASPLDAGDVLTYNITGLTDGVTYFFAATAYSVGTCSDPAYTDQATCESNAGTWTAADESTFSNVVYTSTGGRLFFGGPGWLRFDGASSGTISF